MLFLPSNIIHSISVQSLSTELIILDMLDTLSEAAHLCDESISCFVDDSRLNRKSGSRYVSYKDNTELFSGSILLDELVSLFQFLFYANTYLAYSLT